jgi:FkbM family methyltransferase
MLEKFAGLRLYSLRAHARDDMVDLRNSGCPIETIFDVGANIGQSASKFREAFPSARILCFEPVSAAYGQLRAAVGDDPLTQCHRVALGSAQGRSRIYLTAHSTTSSLVEPQDARGHEDIEVDTVDAFAAAQGVQRIDLLKIDAEGYDLEVLKGADAILASGRVVFVLVEVGFHPGDTRHVLFDEVRDFLMARGFCVFGFYDQNLEWSGERRLRFANACFARAASAPQAFAATGTAG